MQPADLAVTLRRRSAWEATDLGLAMLQRWWRPVFALHALVLGSVVAIALTLGWAFDRMWLAILAIWWLQPLYDRAVLHVLSRAVFGEVPGPRAVLGCAAQWLGTGLLASLTFGRFDLARSFNLPVRQLEGGRSAEARERRRLLGRRARGHAVVLTVVWVHFEAALIWSAAALGELLLPAQLARARAHDEAALGGLFQAISSSSVADGLVYAAVLLLLEPFYVAAGFALYLNRRTLLEGWDIEVALRRIAERHVPALALLVAMACAVVTFSAAPSPAHAQDKRPEREIAEVLKAPEFGHDRETLRWQRRPVEGGEEGGWWQRFLEWLFGRDPADELSAEGIGYALAKALEVLFWGLAAAAAAYLVWWAARALPRMAAPTREPYRPPSALFGMELAPEMLPADVAGAAAALAREGRGREALSLLYRGALTELVHKRGVRLLASHTEGEAVRLAGMPYFAALVDAWASCAYAQRPPSTAQVEGLAQQYREAFA